MVQLLHIVDEGDALGLVILIALVLFIGAVMTGSDHGLRRFGKRAGGAALVAYIAYGYMRFAPTSAGDFIGLVFRAVLASTLVLGVVWISAAAAKYGWNYSLGALSHYLEQRRAIIRQRDEETSREQQRAAAEQIRHTEERERRRREAESQQRRGAARAKVTRAYFLLRHKIDPYFTSEDFQRYLETYLGQSQSTADVEHHATKLIALLKQLAEGVHPAEGVRSLATLNLRYKERETAIRESEIDSEVKEILLLELQEQYEEQVRRHIRETLR